MSKIQFFQESHFLQYPQLIHGFFGRSGGISQGPFASLNTSFATGDDPLHVQENRKRAMNYIGFKSEVLVTNKQVHTNKARFIENALDDNEKIQNDGLVTNKPGIVLGVYGADCPPVLFFDPKANVVAAAHAGWKGALSGILDETISLMIEKGASLKNIQAIIGPSIDQNSYEVNQDYYEKFMDHDSTNKELFKESSRPSHYLFNLKGYCQKRLESLSVHSYTIPYDTYTTPTTFFSYRRTCHLNEKNFGVCLSVIALKES